VLIARRGTLEQKRAMKPIDQISQSAARTLRWMLGISILTALAACQQAQVTHADPATVPASQQAPPVPAAAPSVSLSATPTSVASGGSSMLTWSSTNATSCSASGGWSGNQTTSGATSTGQLSSTTKFTLTCSNSGGTSATQSTTVSVNSTAGVARPSYNTGNGFFVLDGKLYDPDGVEFRIRGVNRVHWDSTSQPGISKSGANTVRMFTDFTQPVAKNLNIIQTQHINYKEVPIVTYAGSGAGETLTACSSSASTLSAGIAQWTSQASSWTTLNKYLIINVANEWGPKNSTTWRDSYISAIATLRAVDYLGPILIDSGGCGQDIDDLLNYSTAVFNSDPQKNVIFAFHIYGVASSAAAVNGYLSQLAALSASAGMVFAVTEFGPGKDIGPSPTNTTPGAIITAAEANGIGWAAWAWDDNDLANCRADDNWFAMTYNCGIYTQTSDLTIFGKDVVLNPTYGLSVIAKPASIF
jgi:mannan endo-1,4-beta-mannosidase